MNTLRTVRIVLILAMVMSLSACGYNRDGAVERRATDNVGRVDANRIGTLNTNRAEHEMGTGIVNRHQNTNVEMSQELADRIADMVEVDRASVLLTTQNAYIAVVLADGAGDGRLNNMEMKRNHGKMDMMRTNHSKDKTRNSKNITRSQSQNLHQNRAANQDDRRLDETRMKRHYNEAQDITSVLKDKITKEVKNHDPHILNVYISANPDFGDRMNGFIDQIQAGHPVRGFINEVNTTFERMFPTNNGPHITPNMGR